MKTKTNSRWAAMVLLAFFAVGCVRENPIEEQVPGAASQIQGLVPTGARVCGNALVVPIADELGGTAVNACFSPSGAIVSCSPPVPDWGTVKATKYTSALPNANLTLDVQLAAGWICTAYQLELPFAGAAPAPGALPSIAAPIVNLAPYKNVFDIHAALPPGNYELNCVRWALKMQVARLDPTLGVVIPASMRFLYAYDPAAAGSPYVPEQCFGTCPTVVTTDTDGACTSCRADVSATFTNCSKVTVTACKPMRQIVVVYDDCSRAYFDMLAAYTQTINAPADKSISHIYVRAGCRGPGVPLSQDFVDTNGYSYPNLRRYRLEGNCLNAACP